MFENPADQARLDNLVRQCSAINRELADEVTYQQNLTAQAGAIASVQELYNAYPENVQAVFRSEYLPRMEFQINSGYEKCGKCTRGLISTDKDEMMPKIDGNGNPVMEEVQQLVMGPDGAPFMDADGVPVTKTVERQVMVPVAHEKERCPHCNGTGEVKTA